MNYRISDLTRKNTKNTDTYSFEVVVRFGLHVKNNDVTCAYIVNQSVKCHT